jgi:hypothetical protein
MQCGATVPNLETRRSKLTTDRNSRVRSRCNRDVHERAPEARDSTRAKSAKNREKQQTKKPQGDQGWKNEKN